MMGRVRWKMVLPVFALIIDVLRGAVGGHFTKKTVSTQIVAPLNPLILNGSFLSEIVYGGAGRDAFPVTP